MSAPLTGLTCRLFDGTRFDVCAERETCVTCGHTSSEVKAVNIHVADEPTVRLEGTAARIIAHLWDEEVARVEARR